MRLLNLVVFTLIFFAIEIKSQPVHTFTLDKNEFLLDGKIFQIISGEMHPARIPHEYWRHRIQMAKAMGCNTIAAYIFWNYHESTPGVFDFQTGNHNIREFIKIAQEEGMWVLLRPGPYVCAEWDFGGLPWWLLSIPDIKIRCMDSRYTSAVEKYVSQIASQTTDLQITKGGPILMLQVENEYGSYGNDREYMEWLEKLWRNKGIDIPFYTADGATPYMLEAGTLKNAAIGLDPGANADDYAEAEKHNSNVPSFCSELYPGWLTHWGEKWQRPDTAELLNDIRWLMNNKKSFNLYVVHGGTNYGFWAGANAFSPDEYQPDVTSYDYDAPIRENGSPAPKYFAIRQVLEGYKSNANKLPPMPRSVPSIEIAPVTMSPFTSVWENLPKAIHAVQPKPMEMFGQNAGFILYRTKLTGRKSGKLLITNLHDYALIFLNGKYIGTVDRSEGSNSIEIPESEETFPVLEILVEGMGRINFAEYMIDRKGITDRVSLNGMTLMQWDVFCLPMDETFLKNLIPGEPQNIKQGLFFKGEFNIKETGDVFLDMKYFQKGVVWVNGINLGRYWKKGPQNRLYCPAPFLKTGINEILVFDLHQVNAATIAGYKQADDL